MAFDPASLLALADATPNGTSTSRSPISSVHATNPGSIDFDQVYVRYFHQVSRWVRALGGLDADVDDFTQEVFLVVRRKLAGFDGRHMNAWLYRIAQKVVSDHRRRSWFRRFARRAEHDVDSLPDRGQQPSDALDRREADRILRRVLAQMSPTLRAAFILYEVEGYSGEHIAELEQIPVNTVYTRLHNGRKLFLKLVAEMTGIREDVKP